MRPPDRLGDPGPYQRKVFERAGGSMSHHFVQTLVYGLFHWSPIKQRLEADEGAAQASGPPSA